MAKLQFKTSELLSEIDCLQQVARGFLQADTAAVLGRFRSRLEEIQRCPEGRQFDWAIPETMPLKTTVSEGGYERRNGGSLNIFAEITGIWTVEPIGPLVLKDIQRRKIALSGKASTKVRVLSIDKKTLEENEIAMWRMEIADDDSPGCYFHTQILGESVEAPFPKALSVPRLPGITVTPMSVVEFVLGEIFQDDWKKEAVKTNGPFSLWHSLHRNRVRKLLEWQLEKVGNSQGSPFLRLKTAQPDSGLFL